jgi:hypothetical protein
MPLCDYGGRLLPQSSLLRWPVCSSTSVADGSRVRLVLDGNILSNIVNRLDGASQASNRVPLNFPETASASQHPDSGSTAEQQWNNLQEIAG